MADQQQQQAQQQPPPPAQAAPQQAADLLAALQQLLQQNQAQQANVPFALSPAQAHQGLLDYTTSAHAKIYHKAIEELKTPFDLDKPNIKVLLTELKARANQFSWSNLFDINVAGPNQPAVTKNLLTEHGSITMDQCRAHSTTYINAGGRDAQNNEQLLICMSNTVVEETKKTMANDIASYTIGTRECGVCYVKLLLSHAHLDTRSATSQVRSDLNDLKTYIVEVAKYDIKQVNTYVKDRLAILTSRGESTTDLKDNLFKAYAKCPNPEFTRYIEGLKNSYEEGADLADSTLMSKAEAKFTTLDRAKKWNELTKEQEEIIALRAEHQKHITAMRAQLKDAIAKKKQARTKKPKPTSVKKDGKKVFTGKWAWRNATPKTGSPHTKVFEGETWHYCVHHGYWCMHKSEDCQMQKRKEQKQFPGPDTSNITASMAAIGLEDIAEEEDYE